MSSSSVPIQIFIKLKHGGKMIPLMVKSSDTILGLKKAIYDQEGIAVHQQRLSFDSKPVEDRQTLDNYNIQDKSTVDTSEFHRRFPSEFDLEFRGFD